MAVGMIGMRLDDFLSLTPQEFEAINEAWRKNEEEHDKVEWERMRMLACITIQPHVKGHMRPQKLLPFPWEKPKVVRGEDMSLEERQKLMEKLLHSGDKH